MNPLQERPWLSIYISCTTLENGYQQNFVLGFNISLGLVMLFVLGQYLLRYVQFF
jgi:hypothetical protein